MSVRFFRTITRGNFSSPGVNSLRIHLSTNIFAWPPFFQQPSSSQSSAIFHLRPIRNVRMIERKKAGNSDQSKHSTDDDSSVFTRANT